MLILAIDSATQVMGVSLSNEEDILAVSCLNVGKTHCAKLLPTIEDMLKNGEIDLKDIDAIAVTNGPGSFTGLRIGISTAKALAFARNIPVIPVSTLDALAYGQIDNKADFLICPVLNAKKNEVYYSIYTNLGEKILEDSALAPLELAEELKKYNKKIVFCGDASKMYWEMFQNALGENAYLAPIGKRMFMAGSLGRIGVEKYLKQEYTSAAELEPFYLRVSEAERQMRAKLKEQGKTLEEQPIIMTSK